MLGLQRVLLHSKAAFACLGGSRALRFASSTSRRTIIKLEDGTSFSGYGFGANKDVAGEVVFSTGMVGYPEALTDPSFKGQILVLTYPLIGNYGVPDRNAKDSIGLSKFLESNKIHAAGLLVSDYSGHVPGAGETGEPSHWNSKSSLHTWLKDEDVPAIGGIDTRLLAKKIRDRGAIKGKIIQEGSISEVATGPFIDPNARNLVAEVSNPTIQTYGAGNPLKILAVDCGIKHNMIRMLVERGCEVKVVPWSHNIAAERHWYDGLFISNGPGDPVLCEPLIEQLRQAIEPADGSAVKPIFGICLGNQLVGLAAGSKCYKLPFGNRGHNQPVVNLLTKEAFITSQNHGFAIDTATLPADWEPLFVNINDGTNEGIMHKTKPIFTAQFHPEAAGGPNDTAFLFDKFVDAVKTKSISSIAVSARKPKLPKPDVKKVLILGSGGLSIGQAGEFDYSGSQAIKSLKEAGIQTVLMNPNIASVQTNVDERTTARADNVYFLPVTPDFIEMVIQKERPDAILISMGGQTALNCGVALHDSGVLQKYGVKVLGTQIDAIVATEDRQIFADKLKEINEKLAPSIAVTSLEAAVEAAKTIQYPVMIRSAFALGGLGSGICKDETQLRDMVARAFSLTSQVLVEKSLKGWKEIEYEVVRDAADNCVTVCNMENFDPLGVHTGDSIVVAPSQTLSNEEFQTLRDTAIKVVRHFGIVGECNIQYALDPHSTDYCIIEVNARLSRSSALASKATGYPLAAVAAKLALGVTLPEVTNSVTRQTTACFEPSLDYVVAKIPRWDLNKFSGVAPEIGSAMKSVGEVMAIGRSFPEAFQKALRMVGAGAEGFEPLGDWSDRALLERELLVPTDKRVFAIAYALRHGIYTIQQLHDMTAIDLWFLQRLEYMEKVSRKLANVKYLSALSKEDLLEAKQYGFSDKQIAQRLTSVNANSAVKPTYADVRNKRLEYGVRPWVKQIDTLAAEYPAMTNYLYMTYHGAEHDVNFHDKGIMVLGSGTYRIGSSVEFDWCSVSAIRTLRQLKKKTVMVNFNPETVSTDYDECDRLYFEELSLERVLDIYDAEQASGVIVSVGGQIPNNIALPLHKHKVRILGTSPESIDKSEDRNKFSALMDSIGVRQPEWSALTSKDAAFAFAERVSYPVLVRPSYVLSGAAMSVAYDQPALARMLENAVAVSPEHPVVITKFIQDAQEIEFDGVASRGVVVAHAICQHVEQAGVHSGDATLILPPQDLSAYHMDQVRTIARKVAAALNITGPFNMQCIASGSDVLVIECNLRASRSFPFVSKTIGKDFIAAATKAMLGIDVSQDGLPNLEAPIRPTQFVGVKAPMFSFTRLRGADPVVGVEMASTGEVACFGANKHEAYLKALLASNFRMPKVGILISSQARYLHEVVPLAFKLKALGYAIYATPNTATFLTAHGIQNQRVEYEAGVPGGVLGTDVIKQGKVDLIVNLHNAASVQLSGNYQLRRTAADFGLPLLTNHSVFAAFCNALEANDRTPFLSQPPASLFDHYKAESDAAARN